jgi:hypothetical protein
LVGCPLEIKYENGRGLDTENLFFRFLGFGGRKAHGGPKNVKFWHMGTV